MVTFLKNITAFNQLVEVTRKRDYLAFGVQERLEGHYLKVLQGVTYKLSFLTPHGGRTWNV